MASEERTLADPDQVNRLVSLKEKEETYSSKIAPYLPGLSPRCIRSCACLYTVTPDRHFIIDFYGDARDVIIASPCSGHGFKHSAAIGEVLAELVTDGRSTIDISPFKLSRFDLQ